MIAFSKTSKNIDRVNIFLVLSFCLAYFQGFATVYLTFIRPEFYENFIAFLLVFIFITASIRKSIGILGVNNNNSVVPFVFLVLVTILYILNSFFFNFSILPAILTIFSLYCLVGFYLDRSTWKRLFFAVLILALTLPILERVQKFFGFPIRMITAQFVSYLLGYFGIGNVSKSAVIVTENHATSIDLPCSGVKSLYIGTLFLLTVYYLQQIKISLKSILVACGFFALLILFNTWRVFSLVFIYDVLDMKTFGNTIHVTLGVIGFVLSCASLWFLTTKYLSLKTKTQSEKVQKSTQHDLRQYAIGILLLSACFTIWKNPTHQSVTVPANENTTIFSLEIYQLLEIPFSKAEQNYFLNSDVEFSKKYSGTTQQGKNFSLLVVTSKSARTHHDPEICLQGLGHEITGNQILQIQNLRIKQLKLNDNSDTVYYWYVGKDKNILDYSERVWEEVTNPNSSWTLLVVGLTNNENISSQDVQVLLHDVNSAAYHLSTEK